MKPYSRILIIVSSLALIVAYFVPIWSIDLDAPQYPDGLGMKINISSMSGEIKIINGLNHYIGMKTIEPDSIKELKFMPYILGILILGGIVIGAVGKKKLLLYYVLFFFVVGIAGGIDFYNWEYDYGHDLNPHAAIKIEGMNYQPPLWGTKQLLNFTAYSYPALGGYIIIWAGIISAALLIFEMNFRKSKTTNRPVANHHSPLTKVAAVFVLMGIISSCSQSPVPLQYGKDVCDFCKMTLVDKRFGGEAITKKGKIYRFDAVECMVHFIQEKRNGLQSFASLQTTDYTAPEKLIDAQTSLYYYSHELPSPMGMFLTSFENEKNLQIVQSQHQGKVLTWKEVMDLVNDSAQVMR